jgi:uncharacterized membrane protein
MKKIMIAVLAIILLSFAVGIYCYPQMPDSMASHWDSQGNVNGHMPKFWGLFLMPIVSVAMLLLFILLPKIDPLKQNIEGFRKHFDNFIALIILFMFYIYLLTISANLGFIFNMTAMIIPALGILFFYVGVLIENAKRNWFIGIRTPWTLSSDEVWEKTHKLGGKLFKISGVIAFAGLLFQKYAFFFVLVPVIFVAIYTSIYSYIIHTKIKKS